MRVFVAFSCPPELTPAIEQCRAAVATTPGAHLLDTASLHMTVIPPWEERDPDAVLRDFAAVTSEPVALTFDKSAFREDRKGPLVWIQGSSTPELERLWLQAWRAIKSHDPPEAALPHVTVARFPSGIQEPALAGLSPVAAIFDRLCLYEARGNLTYRLIGERRLG